MDISFSRVLDGGDVVESFSKAIANVLKRYSERGMKVVDIKEIWIDTSIPEDLMIELLKKNEVEVPDGILEIKKDSHVVWKRRKET